MAELFGKGVIHRHSEDQICGIGGTVRCWGMEMFTCSISLAPSIPPSPVVQRLHSHDSTLTFSIDFHKSFGGRWLRLSRRHACLFWDFLLVATLETRSGFQRYETDSRSFALWCFNVAPSKLRFDKRRKIQDPTKGDVRMYAEEQQVEEERVWSDAFQ
ncbi:uncharacterized protein LOC122533125 [Frieseomelitta varia]|uniref:uncharacterized protein LOC122533125 n=1 Tax=Frieseomelitta varia TaxID=561572 RepID=UPI001CB6A570|nr:uncharacterized protein LOC122533125 [Frieseomelitta varia]